MFIFLLHFLLFLQLSHEVLLQMLLLYFVEVLSQETNSWWWRSEPMLNNASVGGELIRSRRNDRVTVTGIWLFTLLLGKFRRLLKLILTTFAYIIKRELSWDLAKGNFIDRISSVGWWSNNISGLQKVELLCSLVRRQFFIAVYWW